MEIHQRNAKNGWQWIIDGFHLFRKAPFAWVITCFTMLLIAATLALVELFGQFIFTIISPVFLAGLMYGCRELDEGRQLELFHLFAAFKTHAKPVMTIGAIYLMGQLLIVGVVMLVGGSMMSDMLLYGKRVDENELTGVMGNFLTASLLAITLSIPLLMAAWFSPLLVIFHNVPPVIAMQRSFFACLRNFIPFQLYGIILIVLLMLSIMPYGLGLVILIPTVFGSIYVSYKDIFLGESSNSLDDEAPFNYQQATWQNEVETPAKQPVVQPIEEPAQQTANEVQNTEEPKRAPIEPEPVKKVERMVKCAHCGIELPSKDAILNMGNYFCCEEHRKIFQAEEENADK